MSTAVYRVSSGVGLTVTSSSEYSFSAGETPVAY